MPGFVILSADNIIPSQTKDMRVTEAVLLSAAWNTTSLQLLFLICIISVFCSVSALLTVPRPLCLSVPPLLLFLLFSVTCELPAAPVPPGAIVRCLWTHLTHTHISPSHGFSTSVGQKDRNTRDVHAEDGLHTSGYVHCVCLGCATRCVCSVVVLQSS